MDRGSPEWWRKRLLDAQRQRLGHLRRMDAYYAGDHPLAFATQQFRQAFGGLFVELSDNWCETVVNAVHERLSVTGFRFSPDAAADGQTWEMWQANRLDRESKVVHLESLIHGVAYALVWPGDEMPRVTGEHPYQVITAPRASDRREVAAAAKAYLDDDGYQVCYLYLPLEVYRWRSERPQDDMAALDLGLDLKWVPEDREGAEDPDVQPNPLAPFVPVVPVANRPRMIAPARSEIESVVPLQNAVNKLICDMMVSSEFTADAQRYALGWEPDVDPETGQSRAPFTRRERLWHFPPGEPGEQPVSVGQFAAGDLSGFIKAVEMVVQHIASQTRTPPHYLAPGADRLSGESIKSSESGLVSKVRDKMVPFGEAWEQVMRLCHHLAGEEEKARFVGAETMWENPEIRSEAQTADAAVKMVEVGVPWRARMEFLGYSPLEIARMEAERAQEQMAAALDAVLAAPADAGV